jgi:hypothetical protein
MELLLLMVAAWLMVALFTAIHADGQGKTAAWGVVVFFFGIFGMLGYAISLASD